MVTTPSDAIAIASVSEAEPILPALGITMLPVIVTFLKPEISLLLSTITALLAATVPAVIPSNTVNSPAAREAPSTINVLPPRYKFLHCFDAEPKSKVSSAAGNKLCAILFGSSPPPLPDNPPIVICDCLTCFCSVLNSPLNASISSTCSLISVLSFISSRLFTTSAISFCVSLIDSLSVGKSLTSFIASVISTGSHTCLSMTLVGVSTGVCKSTTGLISSACNCKSSSIISGSISTPKDLISSENAPSFFASSSDKDFSSTGLGCSSMS